MMPLNPGNLPGEIVLIGIAPLLLNRWTRFNSSSAFSRALYPTSIFTTTSSKRVTLQWRSQINPLLLPAGTPLWFGSTGEDS
jgi:hypothetical protein